ncbi:MAG: winged helix-turn-helix transcriptional regulator [Deltaproteobacteria bacterium]|nr:winged helix-turn-helix transcriptional regulator [Deltaproteobacteria bacterium]
MEKEALNNKHELDQAHKKKVELVQKSMKSEDAFEYLAETFKALGDHTRIKIIYALAQEELCVYCIAKILNMSDSAISHHLRVLRNIKLVKHRKEGKMVYYSLDDDHIIHILKDGLEHIEEH